MLFALFKAKAFCKLYQAVQQNEHILIVLAFKLRMASTQVCISSSLNLLDVGSSTIYLLGLKIAFVEHATVS